MNRRGHREEKTLLYECNLVLSKKFTFQVCSWLFPATKPFTCSENTLLYRELKQLTAIESCQCRKDRIQRNHIACAIFVWLRLKCLAYKTGQTIYQIKHGLLSNYLAQQLKRPDVPMFLA